MFGEEKSVERELPRLREQLFRDALSRSLQEGRSSRAVAFECLETVMKEASRQNPALSSLYFAGADEDHPFFLKSVDIAVGLAVLPEDEPKSAQCKRHPHQIETIFVLKGRLRLDRECAGVMITEVLERGSVATIEQDQCHRIRAVDNTDAAYIFVKTNPDKLPRGLNCSFLEPIQPT
jgi:mannose-6-phosphate isomerase-like protein (cupin superfamily)